MPGDPHSGSKVWKAPDPEIGKPGENRGKVIAHRDLQPTAAFHDRENCRNFRSRLWETATELHFHLIGSEFHLHWGLHFHLIGPYLHFKRSPTSVSSVVKPSHEHPLVLPQLMQR